MQDYIALIRSIGRAHWDRKGSGLGLPSFTADHVVLGSPHIGAKISEDGHD
jgi:hypothetical protein